MKTKILFTTVIMFLITNCFSQAPEQKQCSEVIVQGHRVKVETIDGEGGCKITRVTCNPANLTCYIIDTSDDGHICELDNGEEVFSGETNLIELINCYLIPGTLDVMHEYRITPIVSGGNN